MMVVRGMGDRGDSRRHSHQHHRPRYMKIGSWEEDCEISCFAGLSTRFEEGRKERWQILADGFRCPPVQVRFGMRLTTIFTE